MAEHENGTEPLDATVGEPKPPACVVCVGASAGGVAALGRLVEQLPPGLDATVVVVLHVSADSPGLLAQILARRSTLPVVQADDLMPIERGTVVVARPDAHVLVHRRHLRVARGPRESGHRPSIDVLFRSAAVAWGRRAIGVVLTGALDDGAAGAAAIAAAGGAVVVQDPAEAMVADMPRRASERAPGAIVAAVDNIGSVLGELAAKLALSDDDQRDAGDRTPFDPALAATETAIAAGDRPGPDWPGDALPVGLSCPDCHGSLFAVRDDPDRVRCRIGHAWTYTALAAQHADGLEAALALAARIISDDLAVQDRLAERAADHDRYLALKRIEERRAEDRQVLSVLETMLARIGGPLRSDDAEQQAT